MTDGNIERQQKEELQRFSRAGLEEMAHLENGLFDAEKAVEATPDDPASAEAVEVAKKRLELFYAEHDNAGAFKFKKFGRRMQELFEPGPDGKAAIEAGEDGELVMSEALAQRRFLLVNMGELDRFNKEGGGHAAGDAALGETAAAVERSVNEVLDAGKGALKSDYQIYRFDGNTFAVDLASVSDEDFEKLSARVREAEPKVNGVKEAAPLTVRSLDFKDVVELVNHVQAELPKEAKLETGEEAAREIVEVMRRASDWDLEVHKLLKRSERMKKKIEAGDPDAKAFFENYAKKAFQDTELGTFEGFEAAVKEGRIDAVAEELAFKASEKRFADGRKVDSAQQAIVDARVKARGIPPEFPAPERQEAPVGAATAGERLLQEKRAAAAAAEAAAASASGPEKRLLELKAESAKLDAQIEGARRDKGTGLLERGVHYEDLEKAIGEGRDVATVFVDMGFLKYFDQMGGAAVGDAALKTAAGLMEQAIAVAGVEGRVYRYGGDEFTIQVEGGKDAADKVTDALEDLRRRSEPIAAGPKSRDEYAPTRLSFNYGLSDGAMLGELYRTAESGGKFSEEELEDPKRVGNIKAEMMTKAADVGIEYNKAYSRFMLLLEELRSEEYASDPARKKQVDALVGFSNKAIFAELGGAQKLRELAEDRTLDEETLEEAVLDYVLDKVSETRAAEKGKQERLDDLLAAQVRIAFLKDRLKEVEQMVGDRERKIASLQASLDRAEEERRKLVDVRGKLDAAA